MENEKTEDLKSGFAFPLTDGKSFATDGMTKRFYAATKAVQGMLSNSSITEGLAKEDIRHEAAKTIVNAAYELADELLKQE